MSPTVWDIKMKNKFSSRHLTLTFCLAVAGLLAGAVCAHADDAKVPLELKLPAAAFKGTPKDIQTNSYTEPYPEKPRPPFMVPAGLKNLATGAKLTSSDKNAGSDTLNKINDGDKEA